MCGHYIEGMIAGAIGTVVIVTILAFIISEIRMSNDDRKYLDKKFDGYNEMPMDTKQAEKKVREKIEAMTREELNKFASKI